MRALILGVMLVVSGGVPTLVGMTEEGAVVGGGVPTLIGVKKKKNNLERGEKAHSR